MFVNEREWENVISHTHSRNYVLEKDSRASLKKTYTCTCDCMWGVKIREREGEEEDKEEEDDDDREDDGGRRVFWMGTQLTQTVRLTVWVCLKIHL